MDKNKKINSDNKNSPVEANQEASARNESSGEGPIEKFDDINPNHQAFEDIGEIQSTDDV